MIALKNDYRCLAITYWLYKPLPPEAVCDIRIKKRTQKTAANAGDWYKIRLIIPSHTKNIDTYNQ